MTGLFSDVELAAVHTFKLKQSSSVGVGAGIMVIGLMQLYPKAVAFKGGLQGVSD